jgi:hypothetical protein
MYVLSTAVPPQDTLFNVALSHCFWKERTEKSVIERWLMRLPAILINKLDVS